MHFTDQQHDVNIDLLHFLADERVFVMFNLPSANQSCQQSMAGGVGIGKQ